MKSYSTQTVGLKCTCWYSWFAEVLSSYCDSAVVAIDVLLRVRCRHDHVTGSWCCCIRAAAGCATKELLLCLQGYTKLPV
jgi:hypothetical protein